MTVGPLESNEWTTLEPLGQWVKSNERYDRLKLRHSSSGDELLVLRIQGPKRGAPGYETSFLLRHFPSEGNDWRDIATATQVVEIEEACRNAMNELPA